MQGDANYHASLNQRRFDLAQRVGHLRTAVDEAWRQVRQLEQEGGDPGMVVFARAEAVRLQEQLYLALRLLAATDGELGSGEAAGSKPRRA